VRPPQDDGGRPPREARLSAEILAEDADAIRAQQPGLRSDLVPGGRLMPSRESSITAFHRLVWRAYADTLGVAP
jgi:hypothetical protein